MTNKVAVSRHTLVNMLYAVRDLYHADAMTARKAGDDRTADQFGKQAREAFDLAEAIEDGDNIEITG